MSVDDLAARRRQREHLIAEDRAAFREDVRGLARAFRLVVDAGIQLSFSGDDLVLTRPDGSTKRIFVGPPCARERESCAPFSTDA